MAGFGEALTLVYPIRSVELAVCPGSVSSSLLSVFNIGQDLCPTTILAKSV